MAPLKCMIDSYLGDGFFNHFYVSPYLGKIPILTQQKFKCALFVVVFGSQFRDASWKGMIGSCILYSI